MMRLVPQGKRGRLIPNRFPKKCFVCNKPVPSSIFDENKLATQVRGYACKAEVADDKVGDISEAWVTLCLGCAQETPANTNPQERVESFGKPRIAMSALEGSKVAVQIKGGLPSDAQYASFKMSCSGAGAEYRPIISEDNPKPGSVVELLAVPELVKCLKDTNLPIELDPQLRAVLQAQAELARRSCDTANVQILALRERLKTRGESIWPHQETGIQFLAERSSALLNDEQGLGKTIELLLAIPDRSAVMVTCPAVAKGNWLKESKRWRPDLKACIINGTVAANGGLRRAPAEGEILIFSFDSLPDTPPPFIPHKTILIVDEAHKGKAGKKTRIGRRLRAMDVELKRKFGRNWLATGTAIKNRIEELYEVIDLAGLGVEYFGTKKRFKKLFKHDPDGFVKKLRTFLLRREKAQVLKDLPAKVYTARTIEITDEDRLALDQVLAEIVRIACEYKVQQVEKEFDGKAEPLSEEERERVRTVARQDVNEAIRLAFDGKLKIPFEFTSRVKKILALAKSQASMELLDELEENVGEAVDPILFFSVHLDPVARAAARPGWCSITGATPQAERERLIDGFQAGNYRGMAITIQAAGVAITLTRANKEVFNDIEWSPADNEQAEDRAHRIGQTQSVQIFNLIANHILDERISELNEEKRALIKATVHRATRTAEERVESVANELHAILQETTTPEIKPSVFAIKTREAKTEDEILAATLLAKHAKDEFTKTLAAQLKSNGNKLSEKQWQKIIPWAKKAALLLEDANEVIPQEQEYKPRNAFEEWVKRSLGKIKDSLAEEFAKREGLTEGEYIFAARLLRKYSSVVGIYEGKDSKSDGVTTSNSSNQP
jgi:hypothetical protein